MRLSFIIMLMMLSAISKAQKDDSLYILFKNSQKHPHAYSFYGFKGTPGELLTFEIEKRYKTDCPSNGFTFYRNGSTESVREVKIDTLSNTITSGWISKQYDTTLLRLFGRRKIYLIPSDSIKKGRSKALLVTFRYCEKI